MVLRLGIFYTYHLKIHLYHLYLQVAELTTDARKFLLQCFKDADLDRDQLLSPEELQRLWSTAPNR